MNRTLEALRLGVEQSLRHVATSGSHQLNKCENANSTDLLPFIQKFDRSSQLPASSTNRSSPLHKHIGRHVQYVKANLLMFCTNVG